MITYKTPQEITTLRQGGKILARILRTVADKAKPGVSTAELDALAEQLILEAGGVPAFKGYQSSPEDVPFPSTLCTSVNDQVVHGIATDYQLQDGDIVSLDIGMRYPAKNGLYTDMAITVGVGTISAAAQQLLDVTKESLRLGIAQVKPGNFVHDISAAVESYLKKNKYGIVHQLVGHGVGYAVHEDPRVPNYTDKRQPKVELKPGLVIAIEPMVTIGSGDVDFLDDGWTVVSAEGGLAAHFEHTVAVTDRGVEIITAE